jgi:KaiC/GvpD/RAD55 family RecA-like ATPase
MQEPGEVSGAQPEPPPEADPEALAQALGISSEGGRALVSAGLTTVAQAQASSEEELATAGLTAEDRQRIHPPAAAPPGEAPAPPGPAAAPEPAPAIEPAATPGTHPSAPPPEGTEPGAAASPAAAPDERSRIVDKWRQTLRHGPRVRARPGTAAPGSEDVLRKWVTGDDHALEDWIQAGERPRSEPPVVPAPGTAPEPAPAPVTHAPSPVPPIGEGPAPPAVAPPAPPAHLVAREETLIQWLTDLLDRVKTDQFDPSAILREAQDLQRNLHDERERRQKAEEELEHVKRGSVAVIKYVRTRESKARQELEEEKNREIASLRGELEALQNARSGATAGTDAEGGEKLLNKLRADLASREAEFVERVANLRRRIVELEGEVRSLKAAQEVSRSLAPSRKPDETQKELEARERDLLRRENELRTRFEEIRIRQDEVERKRESFAFKERELSEREQEAVVRQKALEVEARRIEEVKKELGPVLQGTPQQQAESNRVSAIEEALRKREKELMERETFLKGKLDQLEDLQKQAVGQEAERIRTEVTDSAQQPKVRTGVRRLDDLLFGGVPVGSQVLVNGPAHTGKDILSRLFVIEGLKQGHGAIWVLSDRSHVTVREEMVALHPAYPDLEKRGLVRYVDLYSRSMGVTEADRSVRLLSNTDKGVLDQLGNAVNQFSADLKEKTGTYRLVFESVSTLTAYVDIGAAFRFLQPFVGRRKLDRAAAYYEIETGMHSESDLQTLEHMMDGSVNLKVDQLKTFLSVRGVTDVQSRAWVGYTFTKKAFSLGSFSLDHIR